MLLERDRPMALLQAALRDAHEARGRTVVIGGEAGIGKTALLEAFTRGHAGEARVLWGACEALATPRPLGPLSDIAAQLGGELRAGFAASRPPYELFQSFLDALRELPPAVVVIEDAHWCDDATADFVRFVGRRIARYRALLAVTCRDEELAAGHALLRALADVPVDHVTRVRLEPLSEDGVQRLAGGRGKSIPDLYRLTAGNPLLASELLRSDEPGVAATLRDRLLAQVRRLSAPARALAELVAVIPDRAERSLVSAELPDAGALQECLEQRLLVGEPQHVRYRHELTRRVLEEALPPRRREALNARVLGLLERQPPHARSLARLVHHAEAAGEGAAILRYAPLAGDEAASRGAHRQAVAFYEAAVRHAGSLASRQLGVLRDKLAWAAFSCGMRDKALEANELACACWRESGDTFSEGRNRRMRFDFGEFSNFPVQRAGFGQALEDAVRLLEPHGPSSELAMACAGRAMLLSLQGRHAEAGDSQQRAIAMAESLGNPQALVHVLLMGERRRNSFFRAADLERAARALQLALGQRDDTLAAQAYVFYVLFALMAEQPALCERILAEALQFVAERDFDWQKLILLGLRARLDLQQGDWAASERVAESILRQPELPGLAEFFANACQGLVRCRRGDARGEAQVARALELACSKIASPASRVGAQAMVAEMHWLRGDLRASLEHARRGYDEALAMKFPALALSRYALWLRLAGGLERPAAEVPETPYERALALMDGDPAARREAFAILDRLGATASARRCRDMLLAHGVRGVPRGARASTRANPAGLTAREIEVLAYLDQGLANAEISSRLHRSARTIAHHVSAIIAKLGASNRQQAVHIARRNGLLHVENREPPPAI
ncbi:MAG TPA: AAA family ATPase [Burkholderiales bacterium]